MVRPAGLHRPGADGRAVQQRRGDAVPRPGRGDEGARLAGLDIAAGAVLLASLTAGAVGLLIFLPKLAKWFGLL